LRCINADPNSYGDANSNGETKSDCNPNPDIDADFSMHCS
jgi:hypothetical protein